MNQNFQNNENSELDVNKKNKKDYENLMQESTTNLDGFWDTNNVFVKIILFVLLVIIVVGSIIVFSGFFSSK